MNPVILFFLLAIAAPARQLDLVCGTERHGWQEAAALHRRHAARRIERQIAAPVGRDAGNIAILYTSGGVLAPPNPFNLHGKGIAFQPSPTGFRFTTAEAVYDLAAAENGVKIEDLDDDDTRRATLPFDFPFFGKSHREVWINSDGNVSFEEGDPASSARSIGRLTGGPPRIAPLMTDLDPSLSSTGVRILAEPERFVVTWLDVPEFRAAGTGPLQTFQLRLFPDGSIEFAYVVVTTNDGVAGVAPGRAAGAPQVVSLLEGSGEAFPAAIAERFSSVESLDPVLLAQRFYETHDDSYDFLAVFNVIGLPARSGALATELTVRSRYRSGFGDDEVDIGSLYGSTRRLQAFLNMGPLSQYPADPVALVPSRASAGDTPLSILAHETGHLFLALASIRDPADPAARPMLGGALAHWAFPFNSEASFVEGNRIEDQGENASPRFRTVATAEQYSPLDQYLMGFRAPEEVPPTFLVRDSGRTNTQLPLTGVTFNGTRRNITVDDIVAAEGRRSPDHTLAQREFRTAFILLTRPGAEPSAQDLEKLDRFRREFEPYFAKGTSARAAVVTTLKRNARLSFAPAAGIVQGAGVEGFVQLDRPSTVPVTVLLKSRNGIVALPPSVTVAAGQTQAPVAIAGLRAGVEEIAVEPTDAAYAAETVRLQVAPSRDSLTLTQVTSSQGPGGTRLVEMRVSDINLIPYPGVNLTAVVPGAEEPLKAVTGSDGIARFRWAATAGDLVATIDGSSVAATAK